MSRPEHLPGVLQPPLETTIPRSPRVHRRPWPPGLERIGMKTSCGPFPAITGLSEEFPDSRFASDLSEMISRSGASCAIAIEREASYWEVSPPGVNDVQEWASGRSKMGGIDRLLTPSCDSSTGAQHGAPGLRSPTTATPRARGSIGANAPVCDQAIFKCGQTEGKIPVMTGRCSSIVEQTNPEPGPNHGKNPVITGMYGVFAWRNRWDLNPNLWPLFQREHPKIPMNSPVLDE